MLIEGIAIKRNESNYNKALEKFIYAIKLTIPSFFLEGYRNFNYSNFEIRILMNIALLKSELSEIEFCKEILLYCLEIVGKNNIDIEIKLIFNISNSLNKMGLYKEALSYADKGISLCIENNKLDFLGLLFFSKGISEFKLNEENYNKSLNRALVLYEIKKQEKFKEAFIKFSNNNKIKLK